MTSQRQTIVDGAGRRLITQDIAGCLDARIGASGLTTAELGVWADRLAGPLDDLRRAYRDGSLPHLRVPEGKDDIEAAEAAMAALSRGARTIVFLGTGGSSLGGQALAQLNGWNLPGGFEEGQLARPRTRFYDNLDALTLGRALDRLDLGTTRFVVISKSGGTPETLSQAVAALGAVRARGLGDRIPEMFLAIADPPSAPGKLSGLRVLARDLGFPILDHPPGVGGRFSVLTNVGLVAAIARGLDVRALRGGAAAVVRQLIDGEAPADFAPAVGAAVAIGLAKSRGVRVNVMMPYADRLGRFGDWYVQLWAESLGKNGQGTTPVACLGPWDQHSQLQLFMDGPNEHFVSVVRAPTAGVGPRLEAELARKAGIGFLADRALGDLVAAQADAVPEALGKAGRAVRGIDLDRLDEAAFGALLMHMMLETILAARLLHIDAFDQPAVELAKVLTRQRLSS
ncbi:MAG: glucose-6-phosphate isomerase [Hyphomicrobiaceae bacterium]|nr:glucose-6-phosphate isomerase [Hyphomicrobiaceae bacterium]